MSLKSAQQITTSIMNKIQYILFDAANTLIHKPHLWKAWADILEKHQQPRPIEEIKRKHKILSECIHFPDQTSKEFYQYFNSEVLFALGILPIPELVQDLLNSCRGLAWELFEDTEVLNELNIPLGVASNFNSGLRSLLHELAPNISFDQILISQNLGVAKPKIEFYQKCLETIPEAFENVLYIGDSLKLDIFPAQELGIKCLLIDRDKLYPYYTQRIDSLDQIKDYL